MNDENPPIVKIQNIQQYFLTCPSCFQNPRLEITLFSNLSSCQMMVIIGSIYFSQMPCNEIVNLWVSSAISSWYIFICVRNCEHCKGSMHSDHSYRCTFPQMCQNSFGLNNASLWCSIMCLPPLLLGNSHETSWYTVKDNMGESINNIMEPYLFLSNHISCAIFQRCFSVLHIFVCKCRGVNESKYYICRRAMNYYPGDPIFHSNISQQWSVTNIKAEVEMLESYDAKISAYIYF